MTPGICKPSPLRGRCAFSTRFSLPLQEGEDPSFRNEGPWDGRRLRPCRRVMCPPGTLTLDLSMSEEFISVCSAPQCRGYLLWLLVLA